jgi:hypothetical protein
VGKYFNLEELEDKESCLTEVLFNADGKVTIGVTDGPVFTEASGEWELDDATGSFKMFMMRKYDAGKETKIPTDMGEFAFKVERVFTGTVTDIGGLIAFEGVMHAIDDAFGDLQVGFFEMIDTTEARMGLSDEEAADKILSGKKMKSK